MSRTQKSMRSFWDCVLVNDADQLQRHLKRNSDSRRAHGAPTESLHHHGGRLWANWDRGPDTFDRVLDPDRKFAPPAGVTHYAYYDTHAPRSPYSHIDSVRLNKTLLFLAAMLGHTDCVTCLLNNGADLNFRTKVTNATVLHAAAKSGCVATVDAVVTAMRTAGGECAAICSGSSPIVDRFGCTALAWAISFGNLDVVKYLVAECGFDLNHRMLNPTHHVAACLNAEYTTPFLSALQMHFGALGPEGVSRLIGLGADVHETPVFSLFQTRVPLGTPSLALGAWDQHWHSLDSRRLALVQLLCDCGADPSLMLQRGVSDQTWATRAFGVDFVAWFLELGVSTHCTVPVVGYYHSSCQEPGSTLLRCDTNSTKYSANQNAEQLKQMIFQHEVKTCCSEIV